MQTHSWKIYGGLSLVVHAAVIGALLLFGLDWLVSPPIPTTPLQVGFLSETQVAAAVQSAANEGSAGSAPVAAEERRENRTESASAPSLLPSIKAAAAPTVQEMDRVVPPAENARAPAVADAPASAQSANRSPVAASVGAAVDGGGSGDHAASASGGSGTGMAAGLGDGFSDNGDGSYTAASAAGLSYRILRDAEAYYPEEARSLGYSATVSVTGRVLVGTDGSIESVRILTDAPNLGFRQAAEEAFWRMRFAPIVYQGYPIKLWFEKTLIFQP